MHAIIMGAGEGTRMWPLSSLVNKHLLKLGGKPVIRHIVDKLIQDSIGIVNGITITIICLEKDEKDYEWEFRDVPELELHTITHNTGTAHEFYNALLDKATLYQQDFFLHYGDSITDLDYGELMKFWQERKMKAMIAVTQNIKHDYSEVRIHPMDDRVVTIVEKPKLTKPSWTGIGIFKADYFMEIYQAEPTPKEVYLDFGFHILPAMVKDGGLYAYVYDGRWFDVGNLRSYQKLAKEYQNKDLNL